MSIHQRRWVRRALPRVALHAVRSAAGLAAVAGFVLFAADAANAQWYGPYQPRGYYVEPRDYLPPPYYGRYWRERRFAPQVDHLKTKTAEQLRKASSPPAPQGPLLIAISLDAQRLTLYDNGVAIAHSPVSTGTPSHPTPLGVFSVLEKQRWHRSNLYSAAPMPFMQRITWSGVALHSGVLPGYPASHGCIRLPTEFAIRLWQTTKVGARVIIARDEVEPFEIAHARLFVRKTKPLEPPADPAAPSAARPADAIVTVAVTDGTTATDVSPAALGLRLARNDAPPATVNATVATERRASPLGPMETSPIFGSRPVPLAQDKSLRPGPISVFISRKERRLYVRKSFAPLFDVPVNIERPDQPLGTHVFTAMEFKDDGASVRWTAVSLPAGASKAPKSTKSSRRAAAASKVLSDAADAPGSATAAEALNRIEMPKDAVERISELMSVGASLIISDQGLGPETGLETGFIVLTR